jgi:adenylate cyclase
MALEIERKYLVIKDLWENTNKPSGSIYRQGYLLSDPAKTIRVRVTDIAAYLTIKGQTDGFSRKEFEFEIPQNDARELLEEFTSSRLEKIRYKIPFGGKIWEVDEFLGENAHLLLAEIELDSPDESFSLPPWVGQEVTDDPRYFNSWLAKNPFNSWAK